MPGRRADPELEAATALALELFAPMGALSVRRMFGGAGVYLYGVMFVLLADSEIYLKADAVTIPAFEAAGSGPFVWSAPDGRSISMSYWRLPDSALDDADEALRWGQLGLEAALRNRKPPRQEKAARAARADRPAARVRRQPQ